MSTAKTYIIAEAGVNHNGSLDMAKKMIDVAAKAGADAVKFQTFKTGKLAVHSAPKAEYQTKTTGAAESQIDMIRKLELDDAAHMSLIEHCGKHGIAFLSTPFDEESLDLLVKRCNVSRLKIPSGEITNAPLLLKAAQTGRPIILSTGMATLGEIEDALGVLAFGYMKQFVPPSRDAFRAAYRSGGGQRVLKAHVTLLHCTTEYPAPFAEVNLHAMETMRRAFGLPVGYSDHTTGIAVAIAATALGASLIEKHFTLNRLLPGPDHRASIEPDALVLLVRSIREVEAALGTGLKLPCESELKNLDVVRKSLVAIQDIAPGERFSSENIGSKRPGTGISPFRLWELLGMRSGKAYKKDELVEQ